MKLSTVDLNLLLAFEAMAHTGSVSKAALALGIGQPAMSAALARLRALLGDDLFVRVGGVMQPTPRALRLIPGIQAALDQIRTTLSEDRPFDPATTQRSFTIASTDYTSYVLAPALVAEVARKAAGVDLRFIGYDKADIADLLRRNDIDLALGVFKPPPAGAVRKLLCREHFVGVARRGHPALKREGMTLEKFLAARHALVTVRRDAQGEIDRVLATMGLQRRIALTLPHMLVLPPILMNSDLLAALPGRLAAALSTAELQVFPLPISVPEWRIEMLWNPGSRGDAAHGWIRGKLANLAGKIV